MRLSESDHALLERLDNFNAGWRVPDKKDRELLQRIIEEVEAALRQAHQEGDLDR